MVGKFVNGPADARDVVRMPDRVMEICTRPQGAADYHHYIRAGQDFFWAGTCDHEPLWDDQSCCLE